MGNKDDGGRKHRHFTLDDAHALKVGEGWRLSDVDAESTPGLPNGGKGKKLAAEQFDDHDEEIADLQERMYAAARVGDPDAPTIIIVLQGMDTSGKGGVIRHVLKGIDPQGVEVFSFGRPTEEENRHDFLYRARIRMPKPGRIAVWDRSHYEAVLVEKVKELTPLSEIRGRYGEIVEFENGLAERGVHLIKVMLHIDPDEQFDRLMERLDRPDKHWKFDPGDIADRALWDDYQEAYDIALRRTSTEANPWYCVPANHKWYSRLVVKGLLLETLRNLELEWPTAAFDVEQAKAQLEAT